jgi:hypothetical protein
MSIVTYQSTSKGAIKLNEMNTVHLQNVVNKARTNADKAAGGVSLTILEAELNTRTDRTDVEVSA